MILVKNKLRRLKKDTEDDMLHYMKYSHLDNIDNSFDFYKAHKASKATQIPDITNNFTQTDKKDKIDKETDTYDELNKMEGKYILQGTNNKFKSQEASRGELMTQVNSVPVGSIDKDSSSSSSSDSSDFLGRSIKKGFRLAEFAMNSAIATVNITATLADTLAEMSINNPHNDNEIVSVHSSPPISISSATPPQSISSSASSVPIPTSPQPSSPASSAKTTPRKKKNN